MNTQLVININGHALCPKEFNGERVVTFKDIDLVHERPDGTSKARFNSNKSRFLINEDYFIIKPQDIQKYAKHTLGFEGVPNRGITALTESGYMMLVKTFDDDLAWKVQRQLVNGYFKFQEIQNNSSYSQFDLSPIINAITILQNDINSLKDNQKQIQRKKYSRWQSRIFQKCNLLVDYFNLELKTVMHNLFIEFENMYDLDINTYVENYKYEMDVDKCFQLDAIEYYSKIKDAFETMVDSLLEKYNLMKDTNKDNIKRKTIFDDNYENTNKGE